MTFHTYISRMPPITDVFEEERLQLLINGPVIDIP